MIATVPWTALAVLAGFVLGAGIMYLLARKMLLLLWPSDWLPAIKVRRQRRKMSDPGDRHGS